MRDVPPKIMNTICLAHDLFLKREAEHSYSSVQMAKGLLYMLVNTRLKEAFGDEYEKLKNIETPNCEEYTKAVCDIMSGIETMSRLSGVPRIWMVEKFLTWELRYLDCFPEVIKGTAVAK